MDQVIKITPLGIEQALKGYKPETAIAEYIDNGFDAHANTITISLESNGLGGLTRILVHDNGNGIQFDRLDSTFAPFFQSEKELKRVAERKMSAMHGKNGVGRLTFFKFARLAKWQTVYRNDDGSNYEYEIEVSQETLNTYNRTDPVVTEKPTGTVVEFTDIRELTTYDFEESIPEFLMQRFGWFLELNAARDFSLIINGKPLNYEGIVADRESLKHSISLDGETYTFDIRFIRWKEKPTKEYSYYYFLGTDNVERHKETTTLNNKGDSFYHSVYIKSAYFDQYDVAIMDTPNDTVDQLELFERRGDEVYKQLKEFVDTFLRSKRKAFLRTYTNKLIKKYEDEGAFPDFGNNPWDQYRMKELEDVVREIYQLSPKIFTGLKFEQRKTLIHLLNALMDHGERDDLLEVLKAVIELSSEELRELATLLRKTKLTNVIKTIKLIEDRFEAVNELKKIVFNRDLNANEPDHVQKMIESHYWIFGEEYHLVTAAEPKFEEALRRHRKMVFGEEETRKINHPDKNREMDIFAVRWTKTKDVINNIVIELKNPKVRLGEKQLEQVKKYMRVIRDQDEFNAPNMTWEFYLIGNSFDTSGYLEGELDNARQHGERSLVYAIDGKKFRIYVKTWSEIFTEFELRHSFLLERLELERIQLAELEKNNGLSADDIVAKQLSNSAARPKEFEDENGTGKVSV